MALQNKTTLLALINADITTNGANGITGAELNTILANLNESGFNQIDDVHKLFRNYDPTKSYSVGLPCIYTGIIYQCSTATSGAFNIAHWTAIGGGGGGATNLTLANNTSTTIDVLSDTGTDVTLPSATGSLAGLMPSADKVKTDYITVTGSANLDTMQTNIALKISGSGTSGYLPKYTGSLTQAISSVYDTGVGTIGLFGVTAPTQSIGMEGNSDRSIGVETRTTANEVGRAISLYSGTATVGATNKGAGNFNILTGDSRGTGTGVINFYTAPAGSSGTGTNAATLKMSINGAGTTEFTTSTANSKLRIGHNLKTVLSIASGIGIELSRVADGSYTINGGIYMVDNSTYRMIIASANAGVAFVKNPASDTTAGTIINGTGTDGSFWCGVGNSSSYNFEFRRTWNNGGSAISAYIGSTGTNTNSAQQTVGLYVNNNIVNTSTGINYGLQISASGHTTTASNIALNVQAGRSLFLGSTNADYDISFGATANRTFGVNREISSTPGRSLTIYGGSAALAGTDLAGGNIIAETGTGTGIGGSDFIVKTSTPGATGSSDNTPTEKMRVKGAGNVGIGTSTPNAGAILDLTSSSMALLLPRLTGDGASGITPTNGMTLYITSTNGTFTSVGFWGYEGGAWKKFTLV